jgi:hypothetical protein
MTYFHTKHGIQRLYPTAAHLRRGWNAFRCNRAACCAALASGYFVCNGGWCQTPAAADATSGVSIARDYCSTHFQRQNASWSGHPLLKLSEDANVLCFDGPFATEMKFDLVNGLKDGGFFVVRSPGGFFQTAVKIGDILLQKNATVIIYDFCFSACANYIFVATNRTYVLKDAIVAWHGGPSTTYCRSFLPEGTRERQRSTDVYCSEAEKSLYFFRNRSIDAFFSYSPPTQYTKKMYAVVLGSTGDWRAVFWMWNPANFPGNLKQKIFFESFPADQSEVDDILARLGLGHTRVIYDPAN